MRVFNEEWQQAGEERMMMMVVVRVVVLLQAPVSPLRPHLLAPVLAKAATSSKLKIYSWSLDRLILDCRPRQKS